MAPPAGIEQKKNNKKNKNKIKNRNKEDKNENMNNEEKKRKKKDMKMDRNSEVEKSEPINPSKKNKKRKVQSSSEMNQESDNDLMNNTSTKQKKKKNKKKQKVNNTNGEQEEEEREYNVQDKTITDERFSSSLHDPMFRRMKKKDSKIEIDSRFSKMFENKDFAGSSAPVDKRGKLKKDEKGKGLMMHYYLNKDKKKIEEEEREEEETEREDDVSESDVSSSTDDESSLHDEEQDDDENLGNYDISNYLMADHEDTPTIENETHRLAVVNMDWDHIKAVDLYVVMMSCLPQGGKIVSVSVYPSEFGMKCMEIEASKGPGALLDFKHDDNNHNADETDNNINNNDGGGGGGGDDDVNDDGDDDSHDDEEEIADDMSDNDDHEEEIDDVMSDNDDVSDDLSGDDDDDDDDEEVNEKLRAYELNKLRYYYAVIVCDSSVTANHLYNQLDKTEFLDTSNVFDLRFIPDAMQFNYPPHDVATEVPVNYKEPDFETRALQHSKVKLTWEDEKSERKKVLRRNFNLDQLDELNVYLASSDSSEEEEEESKKQVEREKFLSLLKSRNEIPDSDESEDEEEGEEERDEEKGDMEITFNTDLQALSKKILEKKEKKNEETVWESVLRKKKEKKKALKMSQSIDDHDSDDSNNDDDDFFLEEKKSKDKGKRREKEKEKLSLEREREASRAELELLLAEDGEDKSEKKGYNMKKMKAKGKKGKKEKYENSEEKLPEVNASDDPRFSKMFNSHLFALDPTDPQYKRSAVYLRNKTKKVEKSGKKEATQDESTEDLNERETDLKSKQKYEISAAIRSIKKNIGPNQSRFGKGW